MVLVSLSHAIARSIVMSCRVSTALKTVKRFGTERSVFLPTLRSLASLIAQVASSPHVCPSAWPATWLDGDWL